MRLSFVTTGGGRDGRDSLSHLVGFAACFAPAVVVEGIETEQQLAAACTAGATHVQGFYLSKPVALPQLRRRKGKTGLAGGGMSVPAVVWAAQSRNPGA
jgi:EAL domain-containing protein (putative c-di-GMP-specific phosphodiesterase class I)